MIELKDADDETGFKESGAAMIGLAQSEDFWEGPKAFLEKRDPQWKGKCSVMLRRRKPGSGRFVGSAKPELRQQLKPAIRTRQVAVVVEELGESVHEA